MKRTLIAGAIMALVSTGTLAAPPSGNTNKDAEQDARLNSIEPKVASLESTVVGLESKVANIESELASQGDAIEALQAGGSPGSGAAVTYRYVGHTSATFDHYPIPISPVALNAACKEEFGATAKIASSKEVAAALFEGTYTPTSQIFIWPSDVQSYAYDPHLNTRVDPDVGMIKGGSGGFSPVLKTQGTGGTAACSVPQ